jgi:hypothetical protein
MKQGVLAQHRVRLLLADGHSCYRARRDGERKRKVGHALFGEKNPGGKGEYEGLTTSVRPRMHRRKRHPGPLRHHRQAGREGPRRPHRCHPPQATRSQASHPNPQILQLVQGGRRPKVRYVARDMCSLGLNADLPSHPTRGHHQVRQDLHQGPQDPAVRCERITLLLP